MSTVLRSHAAKAGKDGDDPGKRHQPQSPSHGVPGSPGQALAEAMQGLDEVIHQKARLGIMSTLITLGEADFRLLKETLNLTDGNLSTHLTSLEERGYVRIQKEFRGKKPHTTVFPTDTGRQSFHDYLAALERIVKAAQR